MDCDAPVAIVGAGPVGLSLALGLARCGIQSIVLEKKPALSEHSKALVILPRTLQIFQSWGILGSFMEAGIVLESLNPVDATTGRALLHLDLRILHDITPLGMGLVLPQDRTERLLLARAEQTKEIDVRFGHEVIGFAELDDHVSVQLRRADGSTESVACQYLAGCDGAHSTVRAGLGYELEGKTYPMQVVIADVGLRGERDNLPFPRIVADQPRLLAGVKFAQGRWRIIDAFPQGSGTTPEEEVREDVEMLFGPGEYESIWVSRFNIHERLAKRFYRGRTFLLGDAAHLNSPAGAQGMNGGIQDAHNLAWKLDRALNGGDPSKLFPSYDQERRYAVVHYQHPITDNLTRFGLQVDPSARARILSALALALKIPAVAHRAATQMAMLGTEYALSPLLPQPCAYVGTIAPDLALTCPQGLFHLYDHLYPRAVLALFDDREANPWPDIPAIPNLEVLRIVRPKTATRGPIVRTTSDKAWWKLGTLDTRAVLVRPDGYIGWQSRKPSRSEIAESVCAALGYTRQALPQPSVPSPGEWA